MACSGSGQTRPTDARGVARCFYCAHLERGEKDTEGDVGRARAARRGERPRPRPKVTIPAHLSLPEDRGHFGWRPFSFCEAVSWIQGEEVFVDVFDVDADATKTLLDLHDVAELDVGRTWWGRASVRLVDRPAAMMEAEAASRAFARGARGRTPPAPGDERGAFVRFAVDTETTFRRTRPEAADGQHVIPVVSVLCTYDGRKRTTLKPYVPVLASGFDPATLEELRRAGTVKSPSDLGGR